MDPLPPDPSGYCYLDRTAFDATLYEVAARLLREHGNPLHRLLGRVHQYATYLLYLLYLGGGLLFLFRGMVVTWGWLRPAFLGVVVVIVVWCATRSKRYANRVVLERMCFQCGYPLLHAPTDANGDGVCSKCGRLFHIAYYRRPPRKYKRAVPRPEEPAWLESVHSLDRARMQRERSHAQERENSDLSHEHPTG